MSFNPDFWFILGLILIVLEVVLGFTIVLLFTSLAAFTMGFIMFAQLAVFTNIYWQWAAFFGLTFFWALLLWKPLKKLKNRNNGESTGFQNYFGQTVEVVNNDLVKGKLGAAKWSGTTIRVMLHPEYPEETLKVGGSAKIIDIRDNTFIIR